MSAGWSAEDHEAIPGSGECFASFAQVKRTPFLRSCAAIHSESAGVGGSAFANLDVYFERKHRHGCSRLSEVCREL